MFSWTVAMALAAPCAERGNAEALSARVEQAEKQLGDLDSDGFLQKTNDLSVRVECLAEALSPVQAAELHRTFGLRAYLGQQTEDAKDAFSSARAADPDYVYPFWLVPERHEIRELYGAAEPDLAVLPVLPAKSGSLRFDGVEGTERPMFRPTVVQVFDDEGQVQASAWLRPTDALPPYEEARPVLPPLIGASRTARTTLLVSSGVAVVTAGAAYGLSGLANSRFRDATDRESLFSTQRSANTFVYTSAISGGVAVATLTGAFLVGRL